MKKGIAEQKTINKMRGNVCKETRYINNKLNVLQFCRNKKFDKKNKPSACC